MSDDELMKAIGRIAYAQGNLDMSLRHLFKVMTGGFSDTISREQGTIWLAQACRRMLDDWGNNAPEVWRKRTAKALESAQRNLKARNRYLHDKWWGQDPDGTYMHMSGHGGSEGVAAFRVTLEQMGAVADDITQVSYKINCVALAWAAHTGTWHLFNGLETLPEDEKAARLAVREAEWNDLTQPAKKPKDNDPTAT